MSLFEIKSETVSETDFLSSTMVHIFREKDIQSFRKLVNTSLKYIDGVYFENITEFMNKGASKYKERQSLFNGDSYQWWRKYWNNMPSFIQPKLPHLLSVRVFFKTEESIKEFSKKLGRNCTAKTKFLHYTDLEKINKTKIFWTSKETTAPKYPIYIISKGRWESRLTPKALEEIKCPYRIVIEPQEYEQYAAVIDPKKILVLPFSNLGQGSIPARNWVWEHSISEGHEWHWILDDNIREFYRLHKNLRLRVKSQNIFRIIEQFVERFENIGLSGMHYRMFMPDRELWPPFSLNTRIYSCILIRNDLPFRWRGRFNEDTDLSLRVLKSGLCTVLFNQFLCDKIASMTMKGGNTEELYAKTQQRLEFVESLKNQHPEHVKITKKYGRWHHHVNYDGFRQQLKLKSDINIPDGVNEFGLIPNKKAKQLMDL